MYRSPRKMPGLLALGALGLAIGLAGCNQPGASPTPDSMMHESPTPDSMMNETASPDAMMHESASPGQ
jgi:hypothetical protein